MSAAVGFIKVNAPADNIQHPNFVVTMSLVNLLSGHAAVALEKGNLIHFIDMAYVTALLLT